MIFCLEVKLNRRFVTIICNPIITKKRDLYGKAWDGQQCVYFRSPIDIISNITLYTK